MKTILFLLAFLVTASSWAGLIYPYSRLATKDLDQMNKLIQDKIKESKKSRGDQVIPLKEALQAVYSRPNEDFMIEKIISPLKNELEDHDAYEDTLRALVKEATGALKNPKAFKADVQVTYGIFLYNLISEIQPKASESFEKSILEQIRDAKIEMTKEARDERRLKMMKEIESPSVTAEKILKTQEEAKAKKPSA